MSKQDLEKIKQGLNCCTMRADADCDNCPYEKIETSDCVLSLLSDCKTAIGEREKAVAL